VNNIDNRFSRFDTISERFRQTHERNCYANTALCVALHAGRAKKKHVLYSVYLRYDKSRNIYNETLTENHNTILFVLNETQCTAVFDKIFNKNY